MGIVLIIIGGILTLLAIMCLNNDMEKNGEAEYQKNKIWIKQTKDEYLQEYIKKEKRGAKKLFLVGILILAIGIAITIYKSQNDDVDLPSWWNKSPDEMTDKEYKEYNDFLEYDAPQDEDND